MKNRHTLSVLVEDHPGVLNRVVSLLRRRSFNIDSITVGAFRATWNLADDIVVMVRTKKWSKPENSSTN